MRFAIRSERIGLRQATTCRPSRSRVKRPSRVRVELERIQRRVDDEEHGEREQPGGGSAERAFGCVEPDSSCRRSVA